ncbi:MAG: 16S rRNA (guanine(527)-N(7))-methyltransferase RsmG [bacterium]
MDARSENSYLPELVAEYSVSEPDLVTESIIDPLARFLGLFIKWNRIYNFSRFKNPVEIIKSLILPSLFISSEIPSVNNVLDIGSGPGIPGIPLKIHRPELFVSFLDSNEKTITFLQTAFDEMKLFGVQAFYGRAEDLAHETILRETFDCVIARSFAPIPILAEIGSAFLKRGGLIIAQCPKEFKNKFDPSHNSLETLGLEFQGFLSFSLKAEPSREIPFISFNKTGKCPENYPRNWPSMKKKPLF